MLLPLAALVWSSRADGLGALWHQATEPEALSALKLTLGAGGDLRARERGHRDGDRLGARPRSLPRPRARRRGHRPAVRAADDRGGLTLLALYGPDGPFGVDVAFTRTGIAVRAPVRDAALRRPRGAAGAARARPRDGGGRRVARRAPFAVFRRIVFPNLLPAILSGVALAFARAIGEFGAVVLISGNLPFKTEVSSVYIFQQVESDNAAGAAAVSVLLLAISLAVLLGIGGFRRWRTRHDRA